MKPNGGTLESDGFAVKTVQWTVFSESRSSYAAHGKARFFAKQKMAPDIIQKTFTFPLSQDFFTSFIYNKHMKQRKTRNFFYRLRKDILDGLKNPLTYIWLFLVLVLVFCTATVFRTETKTESGIATPFDSIWFTLVTVFAGYFDYCVQSPLGRVSALILLIIGMLLLSFITGKITSTIMEYRTKKEKGLLKMNKMTDHFIICGYKTGFEEILEGILEANPEVSNDQIILINEYPSEQMSQILEQSKFKGIRYIYGDFTDDNILNRAWIKEASRALIIADYSHKFSELEIDSRTVLAALTMNNLNPGLYIAAELLDSKFEKHLQMAHCDEVILTNEYERSMLASASSGLGFSNVIRELIGNSVDTGAVIEDIDSKFFGKTYGQYRASLKTPNILIGILKNTGNFSTRRAEALREAQKNPDITKIVTNLKKIKSLKSNEPVLVPSDDFVIPQNSKAIFVTPSQIEED